MPTPAVPTLTLCDEIVSQIRTNWGPTSPSTVERAYDFTVKTRDLVEGERRVVVFPATYQIVAENRRENRYLHRVAVLVVEAYKDAGVPLLEWADERVEFVYSEIVQRLDYAKDGLLSFGSPVRKVWTEEIDAVDVYDEEMLVVHKVFWSQPEFLFAELLQ